MSSLPASLLIDVNASERASSNAYARSSPPTADQPRLRHSSESLQGSALLSRLGLSGEYFPAVESANQIGGALDAELAQRCGRQARAVPLVANDDHAQVCAVCLGNMVRSGGVQPPLQDVAVDDQRPRQFPIALPLLDRTCIDHQAPAATSDARLAGSTRSRPDRTSSSRTSTAARPTMTILQSQTS
jgi:hypothetical protein